MRENTVPDRVEEAFWPYTISNLPVTHIFTHAEARLAAVVGTPLLNLHDNSPHAVCLQIDLKRSINRCSQGQKINVCACFLCFLKCQEVCPHFLL